MVWKRETKTSPFVALNWVEVSKLVLFFNDRYMDKKPEIIG
jgi:hypothetical protein